MQLSRLLVTATALFTLITLTAARADTHQPNFTEDQWNQLKSGKTIILPHSSSCPFSKNGYFISGAIVVNSNLQGTWAVVSDVEASPNYLEDMVSARIVSKDTSSTLVEQVMKVKGFNRPFTYMVRLQNIPEKKMGFTMEEGKLRAFNGGWYLFPMEGSDQTLLIYSLHLNPGKLIPQSIVQKSLSKKIPETLVALKNEVTRRG